MESVIKVLNYMGAEVVRTSKKGSKVEVNMSPLSKGIYFIEVEAGDKKLIRKVVLQ